MSTKNQTVPWLPSAEDVMWSPWRHSWKADSLCELCSDSNQKSPTFLARQSNWTYTVFTKQIVHSFLNIFSRASVHWRCWLGGRKGIRPVKETEWWDAGVVICLERGADLHMAELMLLALTASCFSKIKISLVLRFWYRFTRIVPDKWPLNGCVCV